MPQSLLYATPYFAHILHHTRDTTGLWIQSWLLLLRFASLRPAWRKTPQVTEKQSDAKWWFGWEVLQKSRQREYQINSQGQDVRTNSSKDFTTQKWKWKEPTAPIYTFWICSGTFLCVWCECATSIPLKVSTNKKIVVKNCFILAAGNGGRERAWRKNSAENIRGWKNPFVLWLPTANPALLYCTKIVSEKFTEM